MKNPLKYHREKADRIVRDLVLEIKPKCLVCGKKAITVHHFIEKSLSAALRYDFENLIPICAEDHFKIHKGDPQPEAIILFKFGKEWFDKLQKKRRKLVKINIGYYKNIIKQLTNPSSH